MLQDKAQQTVLENRRHFLFKNLALLFQRAGFHQRFQIHPQQPRQHMGGADEPAQKPGAVKALCEASDTPAAKGIASLPIAAGGRVQQTIQIIVIQIDIGGSVGIGKKVCKMSP